MWKGYLIGAFFVNIKYMHIKDSNKYEIWVIVKSTNISMGAESFMKKLLGGVTEMIV
jgi:hypothetical protein